MPKFKKSPGTGILKIRRGFVLPELSGPAVTLYSLKLKSPFSNDRRFSIAVPLGFMSLVLPW